MELLNRFDETIFYKKDSELEYQLKALKKLNSEYPNNDKIAQRLKICELGYKGETEIEYELKNANIGMYVLHDINLKYKDLTAQIDYIIITKACTYFIECKNLVGNITVNERGEFIREYPYKNKKVKESIYSPIRQAERHIEVFKKIWNERNTSFINKYQSRKMDNFYKPLVVLSNSKSILNLSKASKEIRNKIIKSDLLVSYLKKDIENTDKDLYWSKKVIHEQAYTLCNAYHQEIERDYERELRNWAKNNITLEKIEKSVYNKNLKQQLLEFRKTTAKEKGMPPYYIFTNNELDKLLEYKPKNIKSLKELKILTDIKIKVHGEEIIKILNNS